MRLVVIIALIGLSTLSVSAAAASGPQPHSAAHPSVSAAEVIRVTEIGPRPSTEGKQGRKKLKLFLPAEQPKESHLGSHHTPKGAPKRQEDPLLGARGKNGVGVEPWLPARGLGVQMGVTW